MKKILSKEKVYAEIDKADNVRIKVNLGKYAKNSELTHYMNITKEQAKTIIYVCPTDSEIIVGYGFKSAENKTLFLG